MSVSYFVSFFFFSHSLLQGDSTIFFGTAFPFHPTIFMSSMLVYSTNSNTCLCLAASCKKKILKKKLAIMWDLGNLSINLSQLNTHTFVKNIAYTFFLNVFAGNLARVDEYQDHSDSDWREFNLWLSSDCEDTEFMNGNRSWFYFSVSVPQNYVGKVLR